MEKKLPIGIEDFKTIITGNYYYVDKTSFFKPVLTAGCYVQLITRPRRFGKSLFMDTMSTFLSIDPENPGSASRQEKLFTGLNVLENRQFCDEFMGTVPVINLSFKGVDQPTFSLSYGLLAKKLVKAAKKHAYLLESPRLDANDKKTLSSYLSLDFMANPDNRLQLLSFIEDMAVFLARHYERQAVLLIDEYDVPISKAAAYGYYADMVSVIRGLLDPLKSGDTERINGLPVLKKVILTGCLRVSKESIFTGLNNPDVNSVCSENEILAECIGFTQKDVDQLLDCCGLSPRRDIVKKWYDGYRIAGREIYCPWDVLNFCSDAMTKISNPLAYEPQNYWMNSSGNEILLPFIDHLTKTDSSMMEDLVNGEEVEIKLNEQVTYADLADHKSEDFWTLLLFSGYLTAVDRKAGGRYSLKIPNEEIRESFLNRIGRMFSPANAEFVPYGISFAKAAFSGSAIDLSNILSEVLIDFVSLRDPATKAPAENYYHGLLVGLLACARNTVANFESNREAGNGFADVSFTSALQPRIGVILELKRVAKAEDMLSGAKAALAQIRSRHYARGMKGKQCSKVFGFGIAFHQKSCVVLCEELKLED